MRSLVVQYGRIKVVCFITIFSIVGSLLVTYVAKYAVSEPVNLDNLILSVVTPIILSPIISWSFLGLILKIHRLEEEQRKLATFDTLTGLMRRGAFFTSFSALLKIAQRNNKAMCVAIVDIDDFKKINDQYGHAAGDEVLKSFAETIQQNLRDSDLSGRIGGEEFAISLFDSDLQSSVYVLAKIRQSSEQDHVYYCDQRIQYTISIGVAKFDAQNPVDQDKLLRQSDEALYTAKGSGKNCIVEYHSNQIITAN